MEAHSKGKAGDRIEYGRYGNPTIAAAEARLAELEGTEAAILFASGMAAITNVLLVLLSSGDHIIMTDDCYRRTRQFCQESSSDFRLIAQLCLWEITRHWKLPSNPALVF